MDKAAEEVKDAINNGIDLIREGAGINATLATFIIQILATLVLFLIVRFFLWKTIIKIIDKRKQAEIDAINEKNQAIDETNKLKEEAKTIIIDAKQEAKEEKERIINEAKDESKEIIDDAKAKALKTKSDAEEEINNMVQNAEKEIKEEIISTAILLSKKMTDETISEKDSQKVIDNFFNDLEKEHD